MKLQDEDRSGMPEVVITEFMETDAVRRLEAAFECVSDPTLWQNRAALLPLLADCRGLVVRNKTRVDAEILAAAPHLEAVGRIGVGLDNVDVAACNARGIKVFPALGSNAVSVAEYVMASALVLLRRGAYGATPEMTAGAFPRETYTRGLEASGRTMGIVGLGAIGRNVAKRASAFAMTVVGHDPLLASDHDVWQSVDRLAVDDVIRRADVLTLHVPLTEATRGLVGETQLAAMMPGAIVINTSRGGVVDEAALADALRSGHLGGAALDVFVEEPIDQTTAGRFAGIPNLILTPHISGLTVESNIRASHMTADSVIAALQGTPAP